MHDSKLALSMAASCFAFVTSTTLAQQPSVLRTQSVTVDPRQFRFGIGLSGAVPDRAHKLKFGDEVLLLWDLDRDGELTPGGADGLSLDGIPFIVALPAVVLVRSGQFRLGRHKGTSLTVERELASEPAAWIRDAATMTRFRVMHGKRPLRLDKQASEECLLHCNYLRLNPPSATGQSPHYQDTLRAGYTPGGAAAGRESCIWEVPRLDTTIEANVASIWHSVPLMGPHLEAFGCATAHGWSLLRPVGGGRQTPFVHPADGAEGVPIDFASGYSEYPNPVPGTDHGRGCGHPLYALLPDGTGRLVGVQVIDEHGKEVVGTLSCPKAPANPEWPTNSGCAAFVPASPLPAGTRFTATFAFEKHQQLVWQFRTAPARSARTEPWRYTPMPEVNLTVPGEFLGEGRRGTSRQPAQRDEGATPAGILPSWLPSLRVGEVRVVQDPQLGWWCVHSRANDAGLLSLHAFGPGATGQSRAEAFAEQLRR
ncbi:MAG: hypothetical protein KF830_14855 [Planctomycetes bacterium]|nr:hypothetical protein [Planctomycetota bacterium]